MKKSKLDFSNVQERIALIVKRNPQISKLVSLEDFKIELKNFTTGINTVDFGKPLYNISIKYILDMIMTSIAVEMDNDYKNHIKRCKEIFAYDDITRKIVKIDISLLKKKFYINNIISSTACFRNIDDITAALILTKDIREYIKSLNA